MIVLKIMRSIRKLYWNIGRKLKILMKTIVFKV